MTGGTVHLGIIPDGNRRYAARVGISTGHGYMRAADKALEVMEWCLHSQIGHVSAFGVSQENIALRPRDEVDGLHAALLYFCERVRRLSGAGLHLFGDPAGLPAFLPGADEFARMALENACDGARLVVHVGVNYSGQAEIMAILRAGRESGFDLVARSPERFGLSAGVPAVDLVIRTGGQRRLSGFLPFHTAYAELWFTDTLWPAFGHDEFLAALEWYARQERRFGE